MTDWGLLIGQLTALPNWYSELIGYLPLVLAILFGVQGIWASLPPNKSSNRLAGAISCVFGLALLFYYLPRYGDWGQQTLFWSLAGVTVAAAVGTITMRSPVYCAIWFAVALLATAGLFLLQGAQFLSAATVIVYAGAILVTFLFVLMLAQPEGNAYYDRISWGPLTPMFAAVMGGLMVGGLVLSVSPPPETEKAQLPKVPAGKVTDEALAANIAHEQHMARLGGELFSRHLISVEIAGTLLLVALVGAVAIVIHTQKPRDVRRPTASDDEEGGDSRDG